jgi:sigma-B regulation protein RsbU (phosphoserine phosphatase)
MTPRKRFLLKNRMLLANLVSNLIGAVGVNNLLLAPTRRFTTAWGQTLTPVVEAVFIPTVFLFAIAATLIYQRPIRRFVDRCHAAAVRPEVPAVVQRRVLNEPFFGVLLDLAIWLFAALFWAAFFYFIDESPGVILRALATNLSVGLITCTVAFFVLEHVLQKMMVPFFFPTGRLFSVPRTLRISIRVRLAAMLLACNLVPFTSLILGYIQVRGSLREPAAALEYLSTFLLINSLIFIAVGIWLCFLVSSNLARPLQDIIRALQKVRAGNFDGRVQITSNDEIGYTSYVINRMTAGLKERERMRLSMMLAREVQQSLLPAEPPAIRGLDLAGASRYCDETGGDYYDFLTVPESNGYRVGVVVGDVAGHGVSSALLMASARSALRQRVALGGGLSAIVADVNCQLSRDAAASGQFMTLFVLLIDPAAGRIEWVRAGHDPGILYDPSAGRFDTLGGPGLPLGVDLSASFAAQRRAGLADGTIVLLGTDGIWETFNPDGEMFGKNRLFALLQAHAMDSAGVIRDRVLEALRVFRGAAALEDDVTLVIAKLDRRRPGAADPPTPECRI